MNLKLIKKCTDPGRKNPGVISRNRLQWDWRRMRFRIVRGQSDCHFQTQFPERIGKILMLTPRDIVSGEDSAGNVCDACGAARFVAFLTAGTGAAACLKTALAHQGPVIATQQLHLG